MAHYDLMSPRQSRDGKTRWHKVGAAFPREKGGFSLVFDSLPLPDNEGRVTLMMWEAQPRDQQGGRPPQQGGAPAGGQSAPPQFDDEIPFRAEWRL